MGMNNTVGTDYGVWESRLDGGGQRDKNRDNCNRLNNKIFNKNKNLTEMQKKIYTLI